MATVLGNMAHCDNDGEKKANRVNVTTTPTANSVSA